MNEQSATSVPCPRCGAPLALNILHRGMLQCEYCGAFSVLRKLPELAANLELLEKVEREARSVSVFADTMKRFVALLVNVVAGWCLVIMALLFVRRILPDLLVAILLLMPLVIIVAMIFKRRFYSIALALLTGFFLILKTVAGVFLGNHTWNEWGPFSSDGMILLFLGIGMSALATPALLRIRKERLKQDVALLLPGASGVIGVILGATVAVFTYGFPTTDQFLERHDTFLSSRVARYTAFAAIADSGAERLPRDVPAPGANIHLAPDDPCPTLDVIDLATFVPGLSRQSIGLYIDSPLAELVRRVIEKRPYDQWEYDDRIESTLERARCARFVLFFSCSNPGTIGLDAGGTWECRTWLFDLSSGKGGASASFTGTCLTSGSASSCIAESLDDQISIATGGSVRF